MTRKEKSKYYKKKVLLDIADSLPRISAKSESAKRELLLNYKSQKKVENMFAHMIPYEDWSQSGENKGSFNVFIIRF